MPKVVTRRHVIQAERVVSEQEKRIAELRARGRDTLLAAHALERFRERLRMMRRDCAHIEESASVDQPSEQVDQGSYNYDVESLAQAVPEGRFKVRALEGMDLDYWVARAEGTLAQWLAAEKRPSYCSDWAHGGPIVEREKITIDQTSETGYIWARIGFKSMPGRTPLEAAMRRYVMEKFGDELPEPWQT